MAKWALVIAGLKDLQRPADKLSLNQNLALAATGFIWVGVDCDGAHCFSYEIVVEPAVLG